MTTPPSLRRALNSTCTTVSNKDRIFPNLSTQENPDQCSLCQDTLLAYENENITNTSTKQCHIDTDNANTSAAFRSPIDHDDTSERGYYNILEQVSEMTMGFPNLTPLHHEKHNVDSDVTGSEDFMDEQSQNICSSILQTPCFSSVTQRSATQDNVYTPRNVFHNNAEADSNVLSLCFNDFSNAPKLPSSPDFSNCEGQIKRPFPNFSPLGRMGGSISVRMLAPYCISQAQKQNDNSLPTPQTPQGCNRVRGTSSMLELALRPPPMPLMSTPDRVLDKGDQNIPLINVSQPENIVLKMRRNNCFRGLPGLS